MGRKVSYRPRGEINIVRLSASKLSVGMASQASSRLRLYKLTFPIPGHRQLNLPCWRQLVCILWIPSRKLRAIVRHGGKRAKRHETCWADCEVGSQDLIEIK